MSDKFLVGCRICLYVQNPELMYSIYLKDECDNTIADSVFILTGIRLDDDDSLPTKICKKCLTEVLSAKKLRQKCIETDSLFRKMYSDKITNVPSPKKSPKTEENHVQKQEQEANNNDSQELPVDFSEMFEIDNVKEIEEISVSYIEVPKEPNQEIKEEYIVYPTIIDPVPSPEIETDIQEIIVEEPVIDESADNSYSCYKVPNQCLFCQKVLQNEYALARHEALHFNSENGSFVCDFCGMNFKKKCYINTHLQNMHVRFKKYQCKLCEKGYHNKYNFDNHMRSHSNIRPFSCKICTKSFFGQHKLKVHMRIHTNERRYKCTFCPKAFNYSTDRKRHTMMIHTGERPYSCDFPQCDKGFVKRSSLIAHQNTHRKKSNNNLPMKSVELF